MTHDIRYVTYDMWHVTRGGRWAFSQNIKSLAHTVWEWRCFEGSWTKGWSTYWISHKGVCGKALATLGLLIIQISWYVICCVSLKCHLISFFLYLFAYFIKYHNLMSKKFFLSSVCPLFTAALVVSGISYKGKHDSRARYEGKLPGFPEGVQLGRKTWSILLFVSVLPGHLVCLVYFIK